MSSGSNNSASNSRPPSSNLHPQSPPVLLSSIVAGNPQTINNMSTGSATSAAGQEHNDISAANISGTSQQVYINSSSISYSSKVITHIYLNIRFGHTNLILKLYFNINKSNN